jgi:hypothetical protein
MSCAGSSNTTRTTRIDLVRDYQHLTGIETWHTLHPCQSHLTSREGCAGNDTPEVLTVMVAVAVQRWWLWV